eukprot:2756690-Pleurochrysis_carterae.AAC.3
MCALPHAPSFECALCATYSPTCTTQFNFLFRVTHHPFVAVRPPTLWGTSGPHLRTMSAICASNATAEEAAATGQTYMDEKSILSWSMCNLSVRGETWR